MGRAFNIQIAGMGVGWQAQAPVRFRDTPATMASPLQLSKPDRPLICLLVLIDQCIPTTAHGTSALPYDTPDSSFSILPISPVETRRRARVLAFLASISPIIF